MTLLWFHVCATAKKMCETFYTSWTKIFRWDSGRGDRGAGSGPESQGQSLPLKLKAY